MMNAEHTATIAQMSTEPARPTARGIQWMGLVLLGLMMLTWSSGFVGYRYAAQHSGVMLVTFWRFVVAAVLILPFVVRTLPGINWRDVRRHVVVGLLGIAGFIALIASSIQLGVAPGTSSLIANLLPLSIVLMAGFIPGQRTQGRQWLGVALCIAGMLIASAVSVEFSRASVWAYSLPALAVLSLTAATLYQKRSAPNTVPAMTALFIQICATLPVFAGLALLEGSIAPVMSVRFGFSVLWLVVFATLGGYGFYWLCLQRFSMQSVSGALFLTPPVTMIWASVQFGDPLSRSALLGVALTLLGLPFLRRRGQA